MASIIGVFLILVLVAPKKYDVQRSIVINRPVSEVFDYIKYVKNQDNWSPWKKKDPNMKQTFTGTDGELGFVSHWVGNKQVGEGEQEIMGIDHNKELRTQLRFLKPWKSVSDAYIRTQQTDPGKTKVTWGFYGSNKIPFNIFMLFMNMDKAVGGDFEEGLGELKEILEN